MRSIDVARARSLSGGPVAARRLASGEHYAAIQDITGASATTISRVSKSLNYGADGYLSVLKKLGHLPADAQ